MKHFVIANLVILFVSIALAPTNAHAMFCCGKGNFREQSISGMLPEKLVLYTSLATGESKIQERKPEPKKRSKPIIQPTQLHRLLRKVLPASFSQELLGLVMAYRIPELLERASFKVEDIASHVTEGSNDNVVIEFSDDDADEVRIEIHDLDTGKCIRKKTSPKNEGNTKIAHILALIDLSNGGRASICDDGTVKIFNENYDLQCVAAARHGFKEEIDERDISALSDGGFVIAVPDKYNHYQIKRWKPGATGFENIIEIREPVYALTEYTNNFIAVSVSFKSTKLFDIRTASCIGVLPGNPNHETDLLKLSKGRLLSYVSHVGYNPRTEFKVWE